jgi:hypothetical protein
MFVSPSVSLKYFYLAKFGDSGDLRADDTPSRVTLPTRER